MEDETEAPQLWRRNPMERVVVTENRGILQQLRQVDGRPDTRANIKQTPTDHSTIDHGYMSLFLINCKFQVLPPNQVHNSVDELQICLRESTLAFFSIHKCDHVHHPKSTMVGAIKLMESRNNKGNSFNTIDVLCYQLSSPN